MKTPMQLRETADAMEAKERGEPIQFESASEPSGWAIYEGFDPAWDQWLWRPAPKPVTRPWSKPEHVAIGAIFDGGKKEHHGCTPEKPSLITCIEGTGFRVAVSGNTGIVFFRELDGTEKYRWPQGAIWHDCTITEP